MDRVLLRHLFAPAVTAETIIGHITEKRSATPVARAPISDTAAAFISIMSVLTGGVINFPLVMELCDFIQEKFRAPEEIRLRAELGCKVAAAQIETDPETDPTRRWIKVELGEEDSIFTSTLYFIEKKTGNAGETQLFIIDADGEKPFTEFSRLEEFQNWYKQDVIKNKEAYSKHVSPELLVTSTLGVALRNYCLGSFDRQDWVTIRKFSEAREGNNELGEWPDPTLQCPSSLESEEAGEVLEKISDSDWELVHSQLVLFVKSPPVPAEGRLTKEEIQLRAASLIQTRAEEKVRCYIRASLEADNSRTSANPQSPIQLTQIEKELIQIAGVYALVEAMLVPEEAANRPLSPQQVEEFLRNNPSSLNTLKTIFGPSKPSSAKLIICKDECEAIFFRLDEHAVFKDSQGRPIEDTLDKAVNNCFMALRRLFNRTAAANNMY